LIKLKNNYPLVLSFPSVFFPDPTLPRQIERLNGKVRLYEQEKAKGAQKKVLLPAASLPPCLALPCLAIALASPSLVS
jgi:hypothetical protein